MCYVTTKLTSRFPWSVDEGGGRVGLVNVAFWFGRVCDLGWRGE
jgi:hypothetical protein